MARRPSRRFCSCGANLRWERTGLPATWLATCDSEACGQITLPVAQKQELAGFLGDSGPRPTAKPWTRLFLQAIETEGVWTRFAGSACDECEEADLVFLIHLYPLQSPNEARLCLRCGSLTTLNFSDRGRATWLSGGKDWTEPDEAIRGLRRGLRERAQLEPRHWDLGDFG